MPSREDIIDKLRELKPVYEREGVLLEGLFGSFARGEATESSDIDILVDFTKVPDLLSFIEIEDKLSRQLDGVVDLVPKRKVKEELREQIFGEVIAL